MIPGDIRRLLVKCCTLWHDFSPFFLFFSYVYLGKFKEITLAGEISSILLVVGKNVCEMKPLASDEHVVPPVIVNTAIIIMQFLFWSLNSALFRHGKMAALYRQWLQRLTRPDWLYCGSRFLYIRPCSAHAVTLVGSPVA